MRNLIISYQLKLVSGLAIGGEKTGAGRTEVDRPVIRGGADNMPYIPASSIRGRTRSLFECLIDAAPNKRMGGVMLHECSASPACAACVVFGVPAANNNSGAGNSRVIFHDGFLTPDCKAELLRRNRSTELKTEVAIDRVTSAALPRKVERVPAGAIFASSIVYDFHAGDSENVLTLLTALNTLQDKGLGGLTSRGSGQVSIGPISVRLMTREDYQAGTGGSELAQAGNVAELLAGWDNWSANLVSEEVE